MKHTMIFFALAISLGILFALLILWSRCSREKYDSLPPPLPLPILENEQKLFQPRSLPTPVVVHDYLH